MPPTPLTRKPLDARRPIAWQKIGWAALALALLFVTPDLRAQQAPPTKEGKAPRPVRERFVPAARDASKGNDANWSALHQLDVDKPGILMLMAHAGVGDSFPVQEEHGPKLFEVALLSGTDDELTLEVRSTEGKKRLELRRDAVVWAEIGGLNYSFAYPSVTVNSSDNPTTDKAMILVNRFPPTTVSTSNPEGVVLLYSMKFDGGSFGVLRAALARAFPQDNFVTTLAAEEAHVPRFEVRNVRLPELARSIAFLSEGTLTVEVVEKDRFTPGNLWRIGAPARATAEPVKMRAVSIKYLWDDAEDNKAYYEALVAKAEAAEDERAKYMAIQANMRTWLRTQIKPLPQQATIMLIGSGEGVSAVESVIKAMEDAVANPFAEKQEVARSERQEAIRNQQLEAIRKQNEEAAKSQKPATETAPKSKSAQ